MDGNERTLIWVGTAREDVQEFPKNARATIGRQLWRIQHGLDPLDWKPMISVGKGVREMRIHSDGEYRVIYIAKFEDGVYLLHAFSKKTQQTPKHDIDLAKHRLSAILEARKKHEKTYSK